MSAIPYRRSWVDAVIAAIERLPGPPWLFYLVVTVLVVSIGTGTTWLDGSAEVGEFAFVRLYNDVYTFYPLAVMHLLTRVATRSVRAFQPALGALDGEFEAIEYEFTHLRRPMVNIVTAVGIVYVATSMIFDPAVAGLSTESSILSWAVFSVPSLIAGTTFVLLVFFVLRLVVLVMRIHRRATNVDLFNPPAHGAFARLTLASSFLVVLPVYAYSTYSIAVGSPREEVGLSDLVAVIFQVASAIVVFFLPLVGMNRRLAALRSARVAQINRRIDDTAARIHSRAESSDLAGVGDLATLQSALVAEREFVKRLSTLPWEAETLRGFVSSIALPIVVWVATTLLGRLLA